MKTAKFSDLAGFVSTFVIAGSLLNEERYQRGLIPVYRGHGAHFAKRPLHGEVGFAVAFDPADSLTL